MGAWLKIRLGIRLKGFAKFQTKLMSNVYHIIYEFKSSVTLISYFGGYAKK